EAAVDFQRLGESNGSNGRPAGRIAGNDLGGNRGRRPIDDWSPPGTRGIDHTLSVQENRRPRGRPAVNRRSQQSTTGYSEGRPAYRVEEPCSSVSWSVSETLHVERPFSGRRERITRPDRESTSNSHYPRRHLTRRSYQPPALSSQPRSSVRAE